MIFRFPKALKLCKRSDYLRLSSYERRYNGLYISLEIKSNHLQRSRLGITVSRRYGKAHLRNRFKRIVREAFRLSRHQLVSGFDIHVKPRTAALQASSQNIIEDLKKFLRVLPR